MSLPDTDFGGESNGLLVDAILSSSSDDEELPLLSTPRHSSSALSPSPSSVLSPPGIKAPRKKTFRASMMDDGCEFFAELISGYTFRQFVEYAKKTTEEIPFSFSKLGISTAFLSKNKQTLTSAIFRREDIMKFYVADEDEVYVFNILSQDLYQQVKNVAKKEGVRLFKYSTETESIHVRVFGSKSDCQDISTLETRPPTTQTYTVKEHNRRSTHSPNITMNLGKFCSILSGITKSKIPITNLSVYNEGIVLEGLSRSEVVKRSASFGDIEVGEGEYPFHFKLLPGTVDALSKMTNFHTEGIIRVYGSCANVVRLEIPISCYGMVKIYIVSSVGV